MPNQISLVQGVELRDADGHSLGVFRPEEVVNELVAERERLRQSLAELQAKLASAVEERDRLRDDLGAARRERDEYLKWLYALTPKAPPPSPEEWAELEKNAVPFEQVLAELEQGLKGSGDA